jgi:outer membrane protein TolC
VVKIYYYSPSEGVESLDRTIMEADSASDIILLYGEVPAGRSIQVKTKKPAIAVFKADVKCGGDFVYTVSPEIDYAETYKTFKELFDFSSLKVAVSGYAACQSEICRGSQKSILSVIDVPYETVSTDPAAFEKGDAALILEQPQMKPEELSEFLNALSKKGVVTFGFGGFYEAELGMLAVNSRDRDSQKAARSAAVAVMEIITGKKERTDVKIGRMKGLVVNMKAAREAGFSPKWEYLRSAELLNYLESFTYDGSLGFKEALTLAVKKNEDVITGRIDLETAKYLIDVSKSALKPSAELSTSFNRIDDDRARFSQGSSPEQTLDVAIQLQQIIYSEEVLSLRDQAKYNEKAIEAVAKQAELDVMNETAKAYLNVLRAETYMKIAHDNLETTKHNYNLAINRDLAGAANPAELHRWEATIALSKIDLVNASNSVKNSMTELARITGEDIDGYYDLEQLTLENNYSFFNYLRNHGDMMDTAEDFDKFKKAMVEAAVRNSVELRSLKYLIDASDRAVLTAKRKFYLPTVAAQGEYKRFLDKDGEGEDEPASWYDDTEWNVGVKASIPIYEGGLRTAELQIEKSSLRKLYHQKAKAAKLVRQRMITALENSKSSFDSYMLAGESAVAAEKTLRIVADLYARGAVSITELIDAQNAKLTADMNEASGMYTFMEKVVEVERAYGFFSAFSEDTEQDIINILNDLNR